ncbi:MAG: hypothetical protein KGL46_07220 [Hyphomicrobiales bacterium]|nr:hypothetical protein [Hyphomicrobiales bacterium]
MTSTKARPTDPRGQLASFASLFSPDLSAEAPLTPALRRKERRYLFRETALQKLRRIGLAAREAFANDGVIGWLSAADMLARDGAIGASVLPDPANARSTPDGLCGFAEKLTPARLMEGYACGLFPSGNIGIVKWWAPSMRALAAPAAVSVSAEAQAALASGALTVAFDRDFDACLLQDCDDIPLPEELRWAFARLSDAGHAHSFEARNREGELVGGGFGVAVGSVFIVEGVFGDGLARQAALARLAERLKAGGFDMIDAKRWYDDLGAFGFKKVPREDYNERLARACVRAANWRAPASQPSLRRAA